MAVHADGLYAKKLIEERRPNEPKEVMDYRKIIFTPKTKPYFSKIISSLNKIRRSSDWSIRYEGEFTKIAEDETLKDYCEAEYPGFTSLTNWMFGVWMKRYLVDPNAVIFIYPEVLPTEGNEYLKPFPYIFNSCDVIDIKEGDYAVLKNPNGCYYTTTKDRYLGKSFFVVTTERILKYDQIDGRGNYAIVVDYQHGLGELPVYRIGAMILDYRDGNYIYESRVSGIKPEFDEAIREYSDLQAAKVLHIYPERWEYSNSECNACKGTGQRQNPAYTPDCNCPATIECSGCHGKGYTVAGPYSKIIVKPANTGMGEKELPTPPAGYVEKDVEIVKVQEDSIKNHIKEGLASINFEFLADTPLSQSGTAKEVDKDELNNTVHAIAEDLVRNMDWIYWVTAKYRYGVLYSEDDIHNMVPTVAVPEKYDILSGKHLEEQLKSLKEGSANPVILNAVEIECANKIFNNDPEVRDMVQLVLQLDPLANISEDDKMSRLSNGGIIKQDYVISSNIQKFIRMAIEEDKDFAEWEVKDQREKLQTYADEQISEEDADLKVDMPDEEEIDPVTGLPIVKEEVPAA